jgi:site-specific recombinase XerC
VLRKYAKRIGLERGYSAHSMRATFITTALENGAGLEDVQLAAGHADPSTTKLYDRRGYNPEKSASGSSALNRDYDAHHRAIRCCRARDGRPRRFGGVQRGSGT